MDRGIIIIGSDERERQVSIGRQPCVFTARIRKDGCKSEKNDQHEPEENDAETGVNESAANAFDAAFRASGKRTVSEYLCADCRENGYVKYRNRKGGDETHLLIRRDLLREEARLLLQKQGEFYPCLNEKNIARAEAIIFSRRDFEHGPGDPMDEHRRYQGFLDTVGKSTL